MSGYVIRSHKPLVEPFITWVRRNLTSHLKEPYLDPIIERQVSFNLQTLDLLRKLSDKLRELERRQEELESALKASKGTENPSERRKRQNEGQPHCQ